jgi:uncharacterized membrane protein affecting hemolysin expression
MENIEIVEIIDRIEGVIDYVKITNDDGSVTTMTKAIYDEQQAALSTPMILGDE